MSTNGAFFTGKYRNLFAEFGYDEAEIDRRVAAAFDEMFHGTANRTL